MEIKHYLMKAAIQNAAAKKIQLAISCTVSFLKNLIIFFILVRFKLAVAFSATAIINNSKRSRSASVPGLRPALCALDTGRLH